MTTRKKAAIFISGRGSNMSALIRATAENDYPAEIACVISNQADAPGLTAAASLDVRAVAVPRADYANKQTHEAAIEEVLAEHGVELICLAGFMQILGADFVTRWSGRMINIHPSLLPLFKGLDTHSRAIASGMRIHGCSVHFVNREMDGGPIIAQAALAVLPNDTDEQLSERVLRLEHRLYPLSLALIASEKARMVNGKTVFAPGADIGWGERSSLLVPSSIEEALNLEDLARRTP